MPLITSKHVVFAQTRFALNTPVSIGDFNYKTIIGYQFCCRSLLLVSTTPLYLFQNNALSPVMCDFHVLAGRVIAFFLLFPVARTRVYRMLVACNARHALTKLSFRFTHRVRQYKPTQSCAQISRRVCRCRFRFTVAAYRIWCH